MGVLHNSLICVVLLALLQLDLSLIQYDATKANHLLHLPWAFVV